MDLQNIINDRATTTVDFMGEKVVVKYRPAVVTADMFERVTSGLNGTELAKFYCELIASWDLTHNGRDLPVTEEVMKTIPIQLLRAIMAKVMEEVPQGEAGRRSGAG